MQPDHYTILGLDRECTAAQIRVAYRLLVKRHHPDVAAPSADSGPSIQAINLAHEVLIDPARRGRYDRERDARSDGRSQTRGQRIERNISQDVQLRIEEFLRGAMLQVQVRDPANPEGAESYELEVPPETAPGARIRLPRRAPGAGGFVILRLRVRPGARFKARGSDLRCDLRISTQRATEGGREAITGAMGAQLRIEIPPRVERGAVLRVPGAGLPKARGGRGDLLVRITYRPEVRITRGGAR